jgi:sporadic carbohydrate cluster protein (TIGR04323 family)
LNYKGYVSSRSFGGMSIPVPAQNSSLREYVAQQNGIYVLPNLESSFDNCFHQLFGAVNMVDSESTIVMYSLTMLPSGSKLTRFLSSCKIKNISLAFVLENILVSKNFSRIHDELESYKLSRLELDKIGWDALVDMYY